MSDGGTGECHLQSGKIGLKIWHQLNHSHAVSDCGAGGCHLKSGKIQCRVRDFIPILSLNKSYVNTVECDV
jgi:hypothetical protein